MQIVLHQDVIFCATIIKLHNFAQRCSNFLSCTEHNDISVTLQAKKYHLQISAVLTDISFCKQEKVVSTCKPMRPALKIIVSKPQTLESITV